MSIPSWKSYGGINNLEKSNNVFVNNLSANYFTLKNAYVGFFNIQGELSVTKDTHLDSNVIIGGNNYINFDSHIYGNSIINQNSFIGGNLGVKGNVDISCNTLMWGNLHIMQDFEIEKNLKVDGNLIQLGKNNSLYNINLVALDTKLGFNTSNPNYTIDVTSDQSKGFSIISTTSVCNNIIAQNRNSHGIIVETNNQFGSINFFNDNTIDDNREGDCSIVYSIGGNLAVSASNNTLFNSNISVSNRNLGPHTFLNESAVIYDISSGPFLYNIYEDNNFNSGSALTLVADNDNSNTSMNIITPSGYGISMVGGSYMKNTSCSSGSIGLFNSKNQFITSQIFIENCQKLSNRTTIGINITSPQNDVYALHINGTTKISHNEILLTNSNDWETSKIIFSKKIPNNGFIFENDDSYGLYIKYTTDYDETWNESNIELKLEKKLI